MRHVLIALSLPTMIAGIVTADEWPQGPGPAANFQAAHPAPVNWSVALEKNIAWKITLPESGQSTPVIVGGRVFFTTNKPVEEDSALGKDIVAWCCDAATGDVLWKRDIPGKHPLRLSGCFSDASAPPAVCDGERVVFINASGTIACFDLEGNPLWSKPTLSVGRTLPFVDDGRFVFIRQVYPPEPNGNFPHKYKDSPLEMWTQLQALDMESGDVAWTTSCGANMGCAPLLQKTSTGRKVAVVGRGGGHGPPEKPQGISLVDVEDGSTLWTLPLDGFMSTMTYSIRKDQVHLFHKDEHLSVNVENGKITRRISILKDVAVRRMIDGERLTQTESIADKKKGRMITQTSNLLVGPYHYFRSYTQPYLGRVNVDDGKVEYLELPLQLSRKPGQDDEIIWYKAPPEGAGKKDKKHPPINLQSIAANDMKNSRGFEVVGDQRSRGNGWGHVASMIPSAAGEHLYVPVMSGTVYVVRWDSAKLDEKAVVAINDLGPAGESWTRASLSFANGKIFAHTIRELVCIGTQ